MLPELGDYRKALSQSPQLVLTKFGFDQLKQLYFCEKLAYEIWRCGAALRILGKGAALIVDQGFPAYFFDERGDELNRLVRVYDDRRGVFSASATGTVFPLDAGAEGPVVLPMFNVEHKSGKDIRRLFERLGIGFVYDAATNFLWAPFNLRGYYEAHEPLAAAFRESKGIALLDVFAVLGALLLRVIPLWASHPQAVYRFWQRAYEGPLKREDVVSEIRAVLPAALEHLGSAAKPEHVDVDGTFRFLELTTEKRDSIDILLWGPHSIFLPHGPDRVFVDFAWVGELLFNLFFDVRMDDQNFKGDALEKIVRAGESVLPVGECRSLGGTRKQIDAAFKVGDTLLIAECRAVARSFGVERGDPEAINYRIKRCEAALRDADDKAGWLAANPIGTNYDVRPYKRILPVGVTPFTEYIPTLAPAWWITSALPRVMTPAELKKALSDGTFARAAGSRPAAVTIGRV